jgi:hypothetical protein
MPLTSTKYWQVAFSGLLVGIKEILLVQSKNAVFDTGTSVTFVPSIEY